MRKQKQCSKNRKFVLKKNFFVTYPATDRFQIFSGTAVVAKSWTESCSLRRLRQRKTSWNVRCKVCYTGQIFRATCATLYRDLRTMFRSIIDNLGNFPFSRVTRKICLLPMRSRCVDLTVLSVTPISYHRWKYAILNKRVYTIDKRFVTINKTRSQSPVSSY